MTAHPRAHDVAGMVEPRWRIVQWMGERPRLTDSLAALACAGLHLASVELSSRPVDGIVVSVVLLTAGALVWRSRWPMTVLGITVAIGCVGVVVDPALLFPSLPFSFALYSVASRQTFGRAAAGYLVGVIIPAGLTFALLSMRGSGTAPTVLDPIALVALSVGLAVRNHRQRRRAHAEVLAQKLENARVRERARLAAEMHDVVAHSLTVMIALADGASRGWRSDPGKAAQALERLSSVGRDALADMRRTLHVLGDAGGTSLEGSGQDHPTLDALVETFRGTGLPVHLTRVGPSLPDHPVLSSTVYRIVQESLTNALRYANGATRIEVEIESDGSTVSIAVTDDGRPAATRVADGSGRGLLGVAERAASFDGTSSAGPLPSGGWRTRASLRLPDRAVGR